MAMRVLFSGGVSLGCTRAVHEDTPILDFGEGVSLGCTRAVEHTAELVDLQGASLAVAGYPYCGAATTAAEEVKQGKIIR
jgi:hypothetical protein